MVCSFEMYKSTFLFFFFATLILALLAQIPHTQNLRLQEAPYRCSSLPQSNLSLNCCQVNTYNIFILLIPCSKYWVASHLVPGRSPTTCLSLVFLGPSQSGSSGSSRPDLLSIPCSALTGLFQSPELSYLCSYCSFIWNAFHLFSTYSNSTHFPTPSSDSMSFLKPGQTSGSWRALFFLTLRALLFGSVASNLLENGALFLTPKYFRTQMTVCF